MKKNGRRQKPVQSRALAEPSSFPIVGVGASAGGLEAFTELLRLLPPDSGMAFVLIQHLDPTHSSYLSEALGRATTLPVLEIVDGMRVEPNHVYVIPANAEVGILKGCLTLLPRPTDGRGPHLPIDFFFTSLAADRGRQAIGVVLSGTGSDGAEGLRAIKAEEGVALAQDPRSARFGGMPDAAIKTGAVDLTLPIPELATELVRIGRHPSLRPRDADAPATPEEDSELKKVFLLVRGSVGADLSEFKPASVRRRLARRMALRRAGSLREYVTLLREDSTEAAALFEDILIHVTSFFREPEAFEELKASVFPELLKQKRNGGTIRIWCAGCSSGEEAYSLVIALLEFLASENANDVQIQLFGTDISEKAVERARAAIYSEGSVRGVDQPRLARFFTKLDSGNYGINKGIRDRCAFVKHDLAKDPPFSRIDLVSCRNVLIYFAPELQKRVLAGFQFALNQPGYLMLGRAENISESSNLFSTVSKDFKIFVRTSLKSALHLAPTRDVFPLPTRPPAGGPGGPLQTAGNVVRQSESMLLDRYAPPGVIVNDRMEILHFRGHTGPYLEPSPGQPQHDLFKMARKGLIADMQIAISQARKRNAAVRRTGVPVEHDRATHVCDIVVIPIAAPQAREQFFAVLFEEAHAPVAPSRKKKELRSTRAGTKSANAEMARELRATKEYLQSIIDEHQRTNEELLGANEELISSNEELQSLNEELETAKEELQSTNEELSTLNEELHARNGELDAVNGDLVNILASVEVPIVIVDGSRRIRRFTPKARPVLNLLPSDVGRPIDDIRPNLAIENLDQKIAEVIETNTVMEEEVRGKDARWYRMQIRPYTTVDKRIDGAVVSIVDIDALKRALGAAEWARDYARATVEAVQTPLVVLDDKLVVISANQPFHERYRPAHAELEGMNIYECMLGAWAVPTLRIALDRVLLENGRFQRLEADIEIPRIGRRTVTLAGRAVAMPAGERVILLTADDITDRRAREVERAELLEEARAAKASAEDANRTKDQFLATLSHELRTPLSTLLLQAQILGRASLDEAGVKKSAAAIERAARAQAQLIDDLLDISRIVTGKLKMDLQAINLASIVQSAVDSVAPIIESKRIELDLHLDESLPPVSGDPLRLQQAVLNLLTNAIKFSPGKGRIAVTVDSIDGRGRILVSDAGIGIDPAFLPHLFDRFSQEDRGETRNHGGLGLGLAIVRYLVEAHGGTVKAASGGKDMGATFTILLPLMTGPRKPGLPHGNGGTGPDAATIEGVRVLVVEDDAGTREALMKMLEISGAVTRSADSAISAMEAFLEFKPQVLVCDIAMPGEDGYALLQKIRALGPEQGGDVPALALTALASEEDRRHAFEAGFQVHMAKPVDIDHLVLALARLLKPPAPPAADQPTDRA